jgi:hypothetical protein
MWQFNQHNQSGSLTFYLKNTSVPLKIPIFYDKEVKQFQKDSGSRCLYLIINNATSSRKLDLIFIFLGNVTFRNVQDYGRRYDKLFQFRLRVLDFIINFTPQKSRIIFKSV